MRVSETMVAVVPARAGSKRLPGKNLKLLGGRPLVFHTIDALLGHKEIQKVIFTSDSNEYLHAVDGEFGGAVELEYRPAAYASDTTKVRDELQRMAKCGSLGSEWFALCLPTAPFRTNVTVAKMLDLWSKSGEPLFSACEYDFPVQFAFDIDRAGDWVPCEEDSPMLSGNTRSQDIPKRFRPNGAVYIQTVESLFESPTFYVGAKPFMMSNEDSLDIDSEQDFLFAELMWKKRYG